MISILRKSQLKYIETLTLEGDVIDLGAKNSDNMYFDLLKKEKLNSLTFADYFHSGENIISVDFEQPNWCIKKKFDVILAFNVLEHIYNYENFLSEANNIAGDQCKLIILVPFMYEFHKDPNDYHRYTHEALEIALQKTGWDIESIQPTISGRFAIMCSLWEGLLPDLFRTNLQSICMFLDKQLNKKWPKNHECFALGYTVEARKK